MGQQDIIDIHSPLAGLSRQLAFQQSAPYTTPDSSNVRHKDVFAQRLRSGSRPGLVQILPPKSFPVADVPDPETFGPIDIVPAKDTFLYATNPTSPQGSLAAMTMGHNGASDRWRPVMHFDLFDGTGLDSGSVVSLGEITVRIGASNTLDAQTIVVNRLTTINWVEAEATWRRASTAQAWTTGDGSDGTYGGDYTATGAINVTWPSTTSGTFTFDVTTLAQDAVTSRSGQLHILMKVSDDTIPWGTNDNTNFGSKTATNSAHRPKLTISGTL